MAELAKLRNRPAHFGAATLTWRQDGALCNIDFGLFRARGKQDMRIAGAGVITARKDSFGLFKAVEVTRLNALVVAALIILRLCPFGPAAIWEKRISEMMLKMETRFTMA